MPATLYIAGRRGGEWRCGDPLPLGGLLRPMFIICLVTLALLTRGAIHFPRISGINLMQVGWSWASSRNLTALISAVL